MYDCSATATLAQPPKTTAVMAGSNVGTLNRMRGSDAIGRVDCCPHLDGQGS